MMQATLHSVEYGQATISFSLKQSRRKSLAISVLPDLSVVVTAPLNSDLDLIKSKIKKRAPWILKQQQGFRAYLPTQPPRQYVSGETHYYLGRQYRLKLIESENESVKLRGGYIHIELRNKQDKARAADLLNNWLLTHARKQFQRRIETWWERMKKHAIAFPKLRLRQMQKRWGTCTGQNVVYLNPH